MENEEKKLEEVKAEKKEKTPEELAAEAARKEEIKKKAHGVASFLSKGLDSVANSADKLLDKRKITDFAPNVIMGLIAFLIYVIVKDVSLLIPLTVIMVLAVSSKIYNKFIKPKE